MNENAKESHVEEGYPKKNDTLRQRRSQQEEETQKPQNLAAQV